MASDMDRYFGNADDPDDDARDRKEKSKGGGGNKGLTLNKSAFAEWLTLVPAEKRAEVAQIIRGMKPKSYTDIPNLISELLSYAIEGVISFEMLGSLESLLRLQFDALTFDRVQDAKMRSGQKSATFVALMSGSLGESPRNQLEQRTSAPALQIEAEIEKDALDMYDTPKAPVVLEGNSDE